MPSDLRFLLELCHIYLWWLIVLVDVYHVFFVAILLMLYSQLQDAVILHYHCLVVRPETSAGSDKPFVVHSVQLVVFGSHLVRCFRSNLIRYRRCVVRLEFGWHG
jgi:hypothetical protein